MIHLYYLKPLGYLAIFVVAMRLWPTPARANWWRPLVATILRLQMGYVLGSLVGVVLEGCLLGALGETAALVPLRFVLWVLVTRMYFPRAPRGQLLVFALAATVASTGIEFGATRGCGTLFDLDHFHLC